MACLVLEIEVFIAIQGGLPGYDQCLHPLEILFNFNPGKLLSITNPPFIASLCPGILVAKRKSKGDWRYSLNMI